MSVASTNTELKNDATSASLVDRVDMIRHEANRALDEKQRSDMGQYMTSTSVSRLMAGMFNDITGEINLLDAGAGVGSLTAAFIEEMCGRKAPPGSININAYETDTTLLKHLSKTMALCHETCKERGITASCNVHQSDFIQWATRKLSRDIFLDDKTPAFNYAILNPPYRKINSSSNERKLLRQSGIETSNLYSAFIALTVRLMEEGGELVAITPRSFCNGPYFKSFRKLLLSNMAIKKIHIFHARNKAFKEDSVLQENIIFHAIKHRSNARVVISSSTCADGPHTSHRLAAPSEVVNPHDPDQVIHIVTSDKEGQTALKARSLPCALEDLGIEVSTGRVVDFRIREHLRADPSKDTAPLIYPAHFKNGFVNWPILNGRKPNALESNPHTIDLFVPSGTYVLVKRFSSKEERRRIVAAVYDPKRINPGKVGFENHLNYFHARGHGIEKTVARGLSLFLNSSLVDEYFRQFSGHTQVNATDLRSLRYPTLAQLTLLGKRYRSKIPEQEQLDNILDEVTVG